MSSRKKQRANNRQKEHIPQSTQENKGNSLLQRLELLSPTGKFAASLALVLTVCGTYYAFSPKISVVPSTPIYPTIPYSAPFNVKNESLLPLRSIKPIWKFREISYEKGGPLGFNGPYVRTMSPAIPLLESGESTTIFTPEVFKVRDRGELTHVDIEVAVQYRPYLLPYGRSKILRFATIKNIDGSFQWLSKAISELD